MKQHHTPTGAVARADQAQARIHPEHRCTCGRVLRTYDLDVDIAGGRIILDCPCCATRLLEVEWRAEEATEVDCG